MSAYSLQTKSLKTQSQTSYKKKKLAPDSHFVHILSCSQSEPGGATALTFKSASGIDSRFKIASALASTSIEHRVIFSLSARTLAP